MNEEKGLYESALKEINSKKSDIKLVVKLLNEADKKNDDRALFVLAT